MSETSSVWDGILIGDSNQSPYSASEWAARQKLLQGQGVSFPNYGVLKGTHGTTFEPLQVNAKSPASTNIQVEIGAALVAGYVYQNTAAVTLTVGGNSSGNPRIDTVILRVDFVAQTIRAVIKQGTPAGSPVAPTLQQDASIWEIALANIAVANGFAVINQTDISQRQRFMYTLSNGWQPYAYPSTYLVNGNYDSFSLAGVWGSTGDSIAIPFGLNGNMLLYQVQLWQRSTAALTWTVGWDIYSQDVNDVNTSEKTVRRIASSGNLTIANSGVHSVYTLGLSYWAAALPPGQYWLVIQHRGGTPVNLGTIHAAANSPVQVACKTKNTTNPNGDTLDLVTGWTDQTDIPGVVLVGRVLGQ